MTRGWGRCSGSRRRLAHGREDLTGLCGLGDVAAGTSVERGEDGLAIVGRAEHENRESAGDEMSDPGGTMTVPPGQAQAEQDDIGQRFGGSPPRLDAAAEHFYGRRIPRRALLPV